MKTQQTWEERLASIRTRPAMYIGSTGPRGLGQMVAELLDNSVEEAVAGRASLIQTVLHADGSVSVTDDGAGIEVSPISLVEVFTTMSDYERPRLGRGMGIAGVAVVNGLSEWLEIAVRSAGGVQTARFERGVPVGEAKAIDAPPDHGTRVRFRPDPTILGDAPIPAAGVARQTRILSYLVPGVGLTFRDEGTGESADWHNPAGLAALIELLNLGSDP